LIPKNPSLRARAAEQPAGKGRLVPCPPDFRPSPTVVRALLTEQPGLEPRLGEITQAFISRNLATGKLTTVPDWHVYWLNFARLEKRNGHVAVTADQHRRLTLAEQRHADDAARTRDLHEKLDGFAEHGHAGACALA
jgi:hypothetical protein